MKLSLQKLISNYDYTTEIPFYVWQTIRRSTVNAVYWAKEGDYITMLNCIETAESAITMYNNTLHYFKYDLEHDKYNQPITYYELTDYSRIAYLIEAIYQRNKIPF